MVAEFNRSSNPKIWGDRKAKTKRPYSPTKLHHPKILIQLFAKNVFEKVEDHALIESKLSTQEVQLTRTIIFKM